MKEIASAVSSSLISFAVTGMVLVSRAGTAIVFDVSICNRECRGR